MHPGQVRTRWLHFAHVDVITELAQNSTNLRNTYKHNPHSPAQPQNLPGMKPRRLRRQKIERFVSVNVKTRGCRTMKGKKDRRTLGGCPATTQAYSVMYNVHFCLE